MRKDMAKQTAGRISMKAKVTSAAIVASFAIIIGWAVTPLVAVVVDNALNDYGVGLQWDVLFTRATANVATSASLIAGVAAAGAWFQTVRIRVALIAAVIAGIGLAIYIARLDDKLDGALQLLVFSASLAIVGALLAVIIVVVAAAITRTRVVMDETHQVVQEHQKEDPNSPDLK